MSCLCCGSIASPVKKKDRPIEIVDTSYKKGAEQAEQDTNLQVKVGNARFGLLFKFYLAL